MAELAKVGKSANPFMQGRLNCEVDKSCNTGSCKPNYNEDHVTNSTARVCAQTIDWLTAQPAADDCCCSRPASDLLNYAATNTSDIICQQRRKCAFLCCESVSAFCADQCCALDELCGQNINDGTACCVNPSPPILAADNNEALRDRLQVRDTKLCCPFGLGVHCSSGMNCCLDLVEGCVESDKCPSTVTPLTPGHALSLIFTGTLLGVLMFTLVWKSARRRPSNSLASASDDNVNLTSGGIYGNAPSIAGLPSS